MLKKTFAVLGALALTLTLASCGGSGKTEDEIRDEIIAEGYREPLPELPAPRAEGETDYSYDKCSINFKNLGDYMDREDVHYIDLRGVDNGYLGTHIRGFEPVEYFNFIQGNENQLFKKDNSPRYSESAQLLTKYFPKNETIFLMCQSGGRVIPMMKLLESQKYDMSKIYNVGGWNQLSAKDSTVKDRAINSGVDKSPVDYELGKYTSLAKDGTYLGSYNEKEKVNGEDVVVNKYDTKVVIKDKKIESVELTGIQADFESKKVNADKTTTKTDVPENFEELAKAYLAKFVGKTVYEAKAINGKYFDKIEGAPESSKRIILAVKNALASL